ncbi:hypothetical protein Lal_00018608 [Lupinus albus]|nr:hypothetical protein Lal_00018608 [Lupinus albus]
MKTINSQSKELSGLVEIKIAFAASNSLLGHNGPFNAPEEQTTRFWIHVSIISQSQGLQVLVEMHGKMYPSLIREFYSNFKCKNGVYQTMAKNIFIILDEDFLVDVGGLGRFDHP